jgi:hypothetical protein
VLKTGLSAKAIEAGVRTVATLSPSKALSILESHMVSVGGISHSTATLSILFKGLASEGESEAFMRLMQAVEAEVTPNFCYSDSPNQEAKSVMRLLNLILRSMSRLDVDGAVAKAESWRKAGILVESATYSQLAASSLTAGNFAQAEEMLEMRDYL